MVIINAPVRVERIGKNVMVGNVFDLYLYNAGKIIDIKPYQFSHILGHYQ